MRIRRTVRFILLASAAAPSAYAHPGHGPAGFAAGFAHPFSGLDHLLAMVAVGFLAAQLGGRARWLLPAAFVSAMVFGAAAGIAGLAPSGVDWFILASVLILGALVASAARLPLAAGAVVVALAGAFHGLAHGAEIPFQADSLRFLGGMVISTAILHALGVAGGIIGAKSSPASVRWAGAGIAAGGIALLLARGSNCVF